MRLGTFSLIVGLLSALVGVCTALLLIVSTERMHDSALSIRTAVASVYAAEELRALILNYERETHSEPIRFADDTEAAKQRLFEEIDKHITSEAESDLAKDVKDSIDDYFLRKAGNAGDAAASLDRSLSALDSLVELNRIQAEQLALLAKAQNDRANVTAWTLIGLVLVLSAAIPITIRRLIYAPIMVLKSSIERFQHSEHAPNESRNPPIKKFQEIRAAFQQMSETIRRYRTMQLQFIAAVAHDIRSPLTALNNALAVLGRPETPENKREDLLSIALRQVKHLTSLTSDLSDTASIESGQLALKKVATDLVDLVRNQTALFKNSSTLHRFILDLPAECRASCDPERITQVINNLLSNAVKYSPRGGDITIRLTEESGQVRLSVSDQGIGIAVEDQDRIFEPFRRTAATHKAFAGMGLGLSVIKRIAEAHGGRLGLSSVIGEGSTFWVEIPLCDR